MSTQRRFEKRVAIVAGGASGLGAAVSSALAREGARVIIADIDAASAESLAKALVADGLEARALQVDVTRQDDVIAMVRVADEMGGLRALVLSAAVETRADLTKTSDEDWQRVIDVNLKGPFLCMKHGIPSMARSGGGGVVALGSTLGAIGQPGYSAYCASKGALVNLCKQAAIEHAPDGVRVNVLSPSACDTGLFARVAAKSGNAEGLMKMVAKNIPAGRLGHAEDVTAAVLFLASDESSYISGTVLPLDGGLAARRR